MVISTASNGADEIIDALAAFVQRLDMALLSGDDAARLTTLFARGERLCATGKAMAARRAAECSQWAQAGHRSPEQWLAQLSGTSQSAARTSLAVAEQMEAQPALAAACQSGDLSQTQAGEIAAAAEVDPESTQRLVDQASRSGLKGLRDSCRQVVTAGRSAQDDQDRLAGIQREPLLRFWSDRDGAGRVDARMTPDALARLQACLRPYQTQQFEMARQAGSRERPEAYALDALLALAEAAHINKTCTESDAPSGPPHTGRKARPPATVVALIDHAALVRGFVEGEECCHHQGYRTGSGGHYPRHAERRLSGGCSRRRSRHPVCCPCGPPAAGHAIDRSVRPRPHLRRTGLRIRGVPRSAPREGLVEHKGDHSRRFGASLFASSRPGKLRRLDPRWPAGRMDLETAAWRRTSRTL